MSKNNTTGAFPQLFKTTVIIPALNPPKLLIELVKALQSGGIQKIVIVNDGSTKEHKTVFDRVKDLGATVLKHPINRGTGAAIKTGMAYVSQNHLDIVGIITADADGQHTANDILRIATLQQEEPEAVILGVRRINFLKIPFRNFIGNFAAKIIFRLLTRKQIADTQCGLRAMPTSLIPDMLNLNGQKFEYLTQVLVYITKSGIKVIQVPIDTIYSKHIHSYFKPIEDSIAIMKELIK